MNFPRPIISGGKILPIEIINTVNKNTIKGVVMITIGIFSIVCLLIANKIWIDKSTSKGGKLFYRIGGLIMGFLIGVTVTMIVGPLWFETQWEEKETMAIHPYKDCEQLYLLQLSGYLYADTCSVSHAAVHPIYIQLSDAVFPFEDAVNVLGASRNLSFGPVNTIRIFERSFMRHWLRLFFDCDKQRYLINIQRDQLLEIRFGY